MGNIEEISLYVVVYLFKETDTVRSQPACPSDIIQPSCIYRTGNEAS